MAKDKKKQSGGGAAQRAPATSDPRFARLHTDPRFLKPKKDDVKVKIDDRFKGLLAADGEKKGPKSGAAARKTDKYGRKVQKGQSEVEQMRRFYRLDEEGVDDGEAAASDEDDDDEDKEQGVVDYARGEGELESSSEEESSSASDDESDEESSEEDSDEDDDVMIGPSSVVDKAKRKQKAGSRYRDDEDEEDDDDFGDDIGEIDLNEDEDESIYAQLDAQAQRAIAEGGIEGDSDADDGEAAESSKAAKAKGKSKSKKSKKDKVPRGDDTHRLAIVNMDWDHVRSKDLYKVFSSLVSMNPVEAKRRVGTHGPAVNTVRGSVLSVRVYPSDFGKERMAQEDAEGPPKDIFKKKNKRSAAGDGSDSEEEINEKTIIQVDEGNEFDEEALRKYQLDRLRYYYAVATFDSKEAARHVYNEIDGTEMERTANVFDLRFVPDGMEFPDGEDGRDAEFRDETTEDVGNYKGVDFMTDALRHSKVKLTWDQDDPERSKLTRLVSRGGLTKEQLRDDDFKAYLASATESEGEDEDEETAKAQRDKFRALFNLDDTGDYKGKRGGGVFDDEDDEGAPQQGDMEITFMPGLSEAAARKSKGQKKGGDEDDEDETTLDKYKRKIKARKEKRKAKLAGKDGEEQGGSDDDDEAAAAKMPVDDAGFDDPFFASDNDMDMEAALEAEMEGPGNAKTKAKSKKDKTAGKKASRDADEDPEEAARQRAELSLLIGEDEDDERTKEGRQHFDMKDILRVESGKDVKRQKLLKRLSKKKQRQEEEFQARKGKPLIQDSFEIDTKDERFAALMDDHRYAIDPSHPGFVKTNAMKQLLDERRKRQDSRRQGEESAARKSPAANGVDGGRQDGSGGGDAELASLVDKFKKRPATANGSSEPKQKKAKKAKK
ncbi:uncharacterized protein PFL1_00464 [Pseudozyma flocculosa PF-1]|uniref:Related to ESF1 - 18S rRNA factor, nucleolar protein involved in pre-rRNA processing n=1 Tax=Pseudozyma flocculosa TaxID=84751 RepID=A0A5C3ESE8_9BASI|nr:uncharacterized protein PFL1_00464 [Pseudozyma flocculosa PF-1]EPQ32267.1 hypothetical protein PFL1_00464 [Pseudozyma flocculosa PF-1]SPO34780.1 related to ESF1 - 18S rRNA factor, nucleolar protein involved in pre-rRNA processing [Pseudozyma flocculosa]